MAIVRIFSNSAAYIRCCSSKFPGRVVTSCKDQNLVRIQTLRRQWFATKKKSLPFEVNTANLGKDRLVFSNEHERFYKLLTYFGCSQFAFWAYLALFSFQTLKDAPAESTAEVDSSSWWRRMAAKESKYKNGISLLCFAFGYVVLCISVMYPARAVQKLWLLKDGATVRLETFSLLARQRTLMVPVSHVSCLQSRVDAAAQIPMKIKGRWFFFLLDKRGKFHDTELFDFSVGLSRSVK